MKIVFLCARYRPSIGGVERHVEEISERLVAKGHTVTILSEGDLNFGKPGFMKKFRIWAKMIQQIPLFLSADVIHIHDVFFWYLPVRVLLFFKPVYATFHGYEGVVPPTRKSVFLRKLSEFLSKKTIEVGSYIQKWYGTHPTKVIYGGSTYIISKPVENAKDRNKTSYALIGRLTEDIGLPLYVKFFSTLKKNKIPYSLDVYGDGPYKSRIEKYGRVHGIVDETMQAIIKADIICASSYLSIIDALSFGKPVLAFYNNPLKKDYLYGFPLLQHIMVSDNVDDAVMKIESRNKEWNARKIIEETHSAFSWDQIMKDYLELWKK